MLTVGQQKKDYPTIGPPKGVKRPTYWNINCTCLDTAGGQPALALRVQIVVPGEAYAATLRELRGKYGAKNVELLPTPTLAIKRPRAAKTRPKKV
jgi:hypothetical protein